MELRVLALLVLSLLLLTSPPISRGARGPFIETGFISGDHWRLNYTVIAEPLVEDGSSRLFLLYRFEGLPGAVKGAVLWSSSPLEAGGVVTEPRGFSRRLATPLDAGMLVFNVSTLRASLDKSLGLSFRFYLDVDTAEKGLSRREVVVPMTLQVLSAEGGVPSALVYGMSASLISTLAVPVLLYLRLRERRRWFKISSALLLVVIILGAWGFYSGLGSEGCGNDYVLKYMWARIEGNKTMTGTLYLWSNNTHLEYANISFHLPSLVEMGAGCPTPICLGENAGFSRGKYFYHNALRKALVLNREGFEAVYSDCRLLFRLVDSSNNGSLLYYELNASLGYTPSIDPGYYIKLLSSPPLIIALAGTVIMRKNRRGGGTGPRRRG